VSITGQLDAVCKPRAKIVHEDDRPQTTMGLASCPRRSPWHVDEAFIRAAFPDQRIFSFSGSEIVEILPDARRVIVNHTELYPEDRLA
jgi:hypothetical protein